MKIIITLIFFASSFFCDSQTKVETENWIKEKLENYSMSDAFGAGSYTYSVSYTSSEIIINIVNVLILENSTMTFKKVAYIPIKDLRKIVFSEETSSVILKLNIKDGEKKIKLVREPGTSIEGVEYLNEINLFLSNSINNDNLKDRLIKAFDNLIKFYGGIPVKEAY